MKPKEEYISLRNAIDLIQSGQFFAFKGVSLDAKRKKGGKWIEYKQAKIFGKFGTDDDANFEAAIKAAYPALSAEKNKEAEKGAPRHPNHGKWMTRNVQIFAGGFPTSKKVKIHLDLLVRVNGKRVLLP